MVPNQECYECIPVLTEPTGMNILYTHGVPIAFCVLEWSKKGGCIMRAAHKILGVVATRYGECV